MSELHGIIANAHDRERFPVGMPVVKVSGYLFPGEVRSTFFTKAGKVRVVVEATGTDYAGMLNIFSPDQLEPAALGTVQQEDRR